jgi:flagellar protein FlbD
VIVLTTEDGRELAVNADLVERVEATPGTVLFLVDGRQVTVRESVDEVVERACSYRASVLVAASRLEGLPRQSPARGRHLRLLPTDGRPPGGGGPGGRG